jgi:SsrA-binding protein
MAAKPEKDRVRKTPETVNKKALFNYEIVERLEAGITLVGSEVKSLRGAAADLSGSYARLLNQECWLIGATISPYEQAGDLNHEPLRKRKLLLHKSEMRKLKSKLDQKGFTLVPLKIYFNERGLAKVQLGLARGKRQYDKRRSISEREQKKDLSRNMKKYR